MARPGRGTALDDRVRSLAIRFAEEIARAVRQGMADEVTERVNEVLRSAVRTMPLRLSVGAGPGDRRIGKPPVPVRCPVPNCTRPGIRAKRNFCADHSEQLTDAEKRRLRTTHDERSAPKRARAPKRPNKSKQS